MHLVVKIGTLCYSIQLKLFLQNCEQFTFMTRTIQSKVGAVPTQMSIIYGQYVPNA